MALARFFDPAKPDNANRPPSDGFTGDRLLDELVGHRADQHAGPEREDEPEQPIGDAPVHETEINALDYVCEQFAEFLANRPIVLDADMILGKG